MQHDSLKPMQAPACLNNLTPLGEGLRAVFDRAVSLHQEGRVQQAAELYKQILLERPAHSDTLHLLGVVALQVGNAAVAVDLIGQSLDQNPAVPAAHNNLGNALKELLRLEEALASYDRAIALRPDFPEAYSNRGNVLKQLQRVDEALNSYDRAITWNPKFADAWCNRGAALQELTRFDEALDSYSRAIVLRPDYAEAFNNQGLTLRYLGRLGESMASFEKAVKLRPRYAEAHHNLGLVLRDLDRVNEALTCFEKAIEIKPDYAEAYCGRGVALHELKRLEDALLSYNTAITLQPDYADAYSNRGIVLKELRQFDRALESYNTAIALKEDYPDAHYNRGITLMQLKRQHEALASFDRAITSKPHFPEAYNNRGAVLQDLSRLEEALASYERALSMKVDYSEAYSNRGNVLKELNRMTEAQSSYDTAISLNPDFAEAYWNKSLLQLLTGDFQRGWALYEWRRKTADLRSSERNFHVPLWLGDADLRGKTILLHAEQGLGDTIQFCRYALLVKRLGAHVILEVQSALHDLLQSLGSVDILTPQGNPLPRFDYHCPLLSLPLALNSCLKSIPSAPSYLKSSDELRLQWNQRLGTKQRPRIGVAWSGNPNYKGDSSRSMSLAELLPNLPNECDYYCLQKDVRECDRDLLQDSRINYFGDEINFPQTAALIDLMDIVVSTDTSIPHLSASLGKPTWLMLPFVPDWRWMLNRDDSPWYPTMRLFRQGADRSWAGVLRRVNMELSTLIQKHKVSPR